MSVLLTINHFKEFFFSRIFVNTTREIHLKYGPEFKNSVNREGKIMHKLISGTKKHRKMYFDDDAVFTSGKHSVGKHPKYSNGNNRRVTVLNSVFMKYISDLLVTSNLAEIVHNKGLEISRVEVNPNFSQVNVFWASNSEENIAVLDAVLPGLAYSLRDELTQLRVIGTVPKIVFVKDKYYTTALKVDYLLSIADYGEDHLPLTKNSDFKNIQSLDNNPLTMTEEGDDISKDEEPGSEEQTLCRESMPVMRQDIFNLDHDLIMKKIVKYVVKSRAVHRFQPNIAIDSEGVGNSNLLDIADKNMTPEERKEAMAKFILGRKILKTKGKKNKYNSLNVSRDYLEQGYYDKDEQEDFKTEDYIEEDDFEDEKYKSSQL